MANGREALTAVNRVLVGTAAMLAFAVTHSTAQVVHVELRIVTEPTVDETHQLPDSTADVCLGGDFYVEAWVTSAGAEPAGVVGGSIDISFPVTTVDADGVDHGTVFRDLVTGTIDERGGVIDDLGGSTLETSAATLPPWALLARVYCSARESGPATFFIGPGAFRFALAGGRPPMRFGTDVLLGPPQTVQIVGPGGIVSSSPGNGAIDARQPHSATDETERYGWDSLNVTVDRCAPAIVPGDFTITEVGGTREFRGSGSDPPVVFDVIVLDPTTVHLVLDKRIRPGAWSMVTHTPSGTATCLGYLPADAGQDRTSAPGDILALIDSLNRIPGRILPDYAADIDRSGMALPADILQLIDLLNGASAFTPWLYESIGPSPCEGR